MITVLEKIFGQRHPSGKNRHERRAEAAIERGKPQAEREKRAEDHHDLQKDQRADRVARRQALSHERALSRKANAGEATPSRLRLRIREMQIKSRAKRAVRNARYRAKHPGV